MSDDARDLSKEMATPSDSEVRSPTWQKFTFLRRGRGRSSPRSGRAGLRRDRRAAAAYGDADLRSKWPKSYKNHAISCRTNLQKLPILYGECVDTAKSTYSFFAFFQRGPSSLSLSTK